jgi:3-isopropylmalate/(R)-2-methylmalate dehydratase small subunit
MDKFQTTTSKIACLALDDVDTDLIIPAQYLTNTSRSGYGEYLFKRLRDSDQNFFLNHYSKLGSPKILLAQKNFGCGSSREHAVWALKDAGFKIVIATSFADIFFGNSAKNGLLLITLSEEQILELFKLSNDPKFGLTINLEEQKISSENFNVTFEYEPFRKYCLLNGLDDLDYILSKKEEIDNFKQKRAAQLFYRSTTANN